VSPGAPRRGALPRLQAAFQAGELDLAWQQLSKDRGDLASRMFSKAKGVNAAHCVSKFSINREDHRSVMSGKQENVENLASKG
jgi:hypothetical protein